MTGELLRADVLNGADARGRESDLARMGLGVVDEFRKAIDRQPLANDDHVRRLHRECDRLEALHRIPAEIGKQRGIDRKQTSELQSLMRISYTLLSLKHN